MKYELQTYTLNLKERNGRIKKIKADDIGLKYNSYRQFENFKNEQNPLKWFSSFFNTNSSKMTAEITYDKEALKEKINNLSCFKASNIIKPVNARIIYADNAFVIVDDVKGNLVNKDILLKRVEEAVSRQDKTIDLDSANCYINPKYISKSPIVIEAKDMLNKYISSKITYTFGDRQETLDTSTISKWLAVDDNFKVKLDEGKVKAYVRLLSYKYNTIGKTRNFITSSGDTINIGGGNYGWRIDIDKEIQDLLAAIKGGQTVVKEPAYAQVAASHGASDIGNTYVEVDMTKQHLWFYKNGSLLVEGDVVTGNVSLNDTTPAGIYRLKYKQKNAKLKGQDYNVPVSFWMPFNGNIGIHDATWRNTFGGNIYKTNGSHGCVNAPYALAQTIFENIDAGTPIVCYYEPVDKELPADKEPPADKKP